MQLTAKYKLPYPEDFETVSPDRDLQALAEAAEAILTLGLPTGSILPFNGTTLPAGWAWCDGSAHGSGALQAVIGSANTPDLRGRFLGGAGTVGHGAVGGADAVTVTLAQLGSHTHAGPTGQQDADHTHGGTPPAGGSAATDPVHSHGGSWATTNNTRHIPTVRGEGASFGEGGNNDTAKAMATPARTDPTTAHGHGMNAFAITVATDGDAHVHGDVASTAAGGGQARPNVPAHVSLNHIIKL